MVVMSASLPSVNELVTDLLGVLDVTTKSLPFCCISTTGLISLAILMVSSGNPAKIDKTGHFVMEIAKQQIVPSNKGTKDPNQYWKVMSKLNTNPGLDSSLLYEFFAPFLLVWLCFGVISGDVSHYALFPKGCPWGDSAP